MSQRKIISHAVILQGKESLIAELHRRCQIVAISLDQFKNIRKESIDLMSKFIKGNLSDQRKLIESNLSGIILAICEIVEKINHDRNVMTIILTILDGILCDEKKAIKELSEVMLEQTPPYSLLANLRKIMNTTDHDQINYDAALHISSVLVANMKSKNKQQTEAFEFLLNDVKLDFNLFRTNVSRAHSKYTGIAISASLAHLLRVSSLLKYFLNNEGTHILISLMKSHSNELQTMYYCLIMLWILSFERSCVHYFEDPENAFIRLTVESIQRFSREKIIRTSFAIFKNLVDVSMASVELMVESSLLKILDNLLKGTIKDESVLEDIQYVGEILERNLKVLSSFEKYYKEINSQMLEWSPVHSEKFWKENVKKFEDQDFLLIRKLVHLLTSDRKKNIIISCYDIGEFCRFHPFGKNVLEKLEGKKIIMDLAKSEDPAIKEQALLSLQKIMIHNWQSISS